MKWESRTKELTKKLIENGTNEVLVLAGDFSEWNCQTLWILEEAATQYERVYFTFGNHDLYLLSKTQRQKYVDSIGRLEELIEKASSIPNVVPLIKSVDHYKGKMFAGDVMWYLPKTQEDWAFYNDVSNDSRHITANGYAREDVVRKLYQESMDWYDSLEDFDIDVFVSHIPPVHPLISKYNPNGCYMTDVPFINTKHWICGHDHLQGKFSKAGVYFYMNAIGYPDQYSKSSVNTIPNGKIDEILDFRVCTFEI